MESCKKGGGVVTTHNGIRDLLWKFIKDYIDPHALREQRLESLKLGRLQDMLPGDDQADVLDVVWHENRRMLAIDIAVVHGCREAVGGGGLGPLSAPVTRR